MNKKQVLGLSLIFTLIFSGIAIGQNLGLSSMDSDSKQVSDPEQVSDSKQVSDSVVADDLAKEDEDSYEDSPSTIIRMISDGARIDDKILAENKIVPAIPDSRKSGKSGFTGTVEIYDKDSLIATSSYIKGFKLDEISLKADELKEEFPQNHISECQTIDNPGIYVLDSTVYGESGCFEITSSNVLLDCDHHSIIFATQSPGSAVRSSGNNVLGIKNCGIVQMNQQENLPAIDIRGGSNIAIANNAVKSGSYKANLISLIGTNLVTVIGNSLETSGERSNAISAIQSKNLNIIDNSVSTSGDRSAGIYLNSILKSSVESNSISTSGFVSPAVYLSTSGRNELSDNKIKNLGDDSPAFLVYGQSIDNTFQGNKVFQASDGFRFDAGIESGAVMQDRNKFIGNKLESTGRDFDLISTSPGSNITLIGQGIGKYALPEGGVYAVIMREQGEIRFTEPIIGSGNSGTDAIIISQNSIQIKSALAPGFDKKALIVFKNIKDIFNDPVVLKNDDLCTECELITSIHQNTIAVRIPGAGNYKIGERPQQLESITEEIIILSNKNGGSSCITGWACEEWSSCALDDNGQGIRTRTCSPEVSYCYADADEKPAESESCTVEQTEEESQPGFMARITGAVIGFGRDAPVLATIVFIGLIGGMYMLVALARKRFAGKKRK